MFASFLIRLSSKMCRLQNATPYVKCTPMTHGPTILDPDVFVRVCVPHLLILICVAHEREHHFLDYVLRVQQTLLDGKS